MFPEDKIIDIFQCAMISAKFLTKLLNKML